MTKHETLNQILAAAIFQAACSGDDPTTAAKRAAIAFRSGLAEFRLSPSDEVQPQAPKEVKPNKRRQRDHF